MRFLSILSIFLLFFYGLCLCQEKKLEIPVNQWVKIANSPADPLNRETPPARGSSWVYNQDDHLFYRYGGFTPRYSNALVTFNPATKMWTEIFADDENYPETRAPGLAGASMAYDPSAKKIWIAAGFSRSAEFGKQGVWNYDVEKGAFTFFANLPTQMKRIAFAFDRGIAVASPAPTSDIPRGVTFVLDLKTAEWSQKPSKITPNESFRGNYPIVYHQAANKMVVIANPKDTIVTYLLDLDNYQWEQLEIQGPPGLKRWFYNVMYEPKNKLVFLFGGHAARDADYYNKLENPYYNDTWVLDLEKKEWKELKIPGPSTVKGRHSAKIEYNVLTYSTAYDYDSNNQCILFSDTDRGVWALKYDPTQPIATDLPENPPALIVGETSIEMTTMNYTTPFKEGERTNEIFRKLPSGLNEKLINLADNTMIPLGGRPVGAEISWAYSPKFGVFFDCGGCGNTSAPFWGGYGNDISYYDPVTEKYYARRVGDVSGASRPMNGCTRSIIWDSKREVYWLLGGTASGPFQPSFPLKTPGNYIYDPLTDEVRVMPTIGKSEYIHGHFVFLNYDENADIFVAPKEDGKTAEFNCAESRWQYFENTNSPGPLFNYNRTVYVKSQKKLFMINYVETGKVSDSKPDGWVGDKAAAGKETTIWEEDKKTKKYIQKILGTFMYDAQTHKWEKLKTQNTPTYRNNKYGLAYDPYNDIVLLIGGHIGWNGPVVGDVWAYHVQKNDWEKLEIHMEGKLKPRYSETLRADFDTRHNAFIFTEGTDRIWAYRYKKGNWKPEK